jgi:hypothetical protein
MAKTVAEKHFLACLEKASSKAGQLGEDIIKRNINEFNNEKKNYEAKIKKDASEYKKSVLAVKEVDSIRKLIPGGKSALLDVAVGTAESVVERVSGYNTMLKLASEKYRDVVDNEKDLAEAKKNVAQEYKSINKLIKSGFITKIEYRSGKGLFWTYPAMHYVAEGKVFFLGYPEAGLSETNGDGFSLRLPSYKSDGDSFEGTYHMRNRPQGNDHCLGGYEEILKILAAKRQLTSLIRMFREYFMSCNPKSVHNRPPHDVMDINNPQVIDDSWKEWVKKNPDYKFPPVAEAVERCDNCNRTMDDCECDTGDGDDN